jgi:hypothetical protein
MASRRCLARSVGPGITGARPPAQDRTQNNVLMGIAVAAFVALFVFNVAFPIVVATAGVCGWIASRVRPELFAAKTAANTDTGPAPLVPDDALHGERPSLRRELRLIGVGSVLWAGPIASAAAIFGRSHAIVDEGLFFSGTALTGITAAVVGVIANLSIYFSIHSLFSHTHTYDRGPVHLTVPVWSTISPRALFVTVLAFVLVFRFKLPVLRVLGICAAVGVAVYFASR